MAISVYHGERTSKHKYWLVKQISGNLSQTSTDIITQCQGKVFSFPRVTYYWVYRTWNVVYLTFIEINLFVNTLNLSRPLQRGGRKEAANCFLMEEVNNSNKETKQSRPLISSRPVIWNRNSLLDWLSDSTSSHLIREQFRGNEKFILWLFRARARPDDGLEPSRRPSSHTRLYYSSISPNICLLFSSN